MSKNAQYRKELAQLKSDPCTEVTRRILQIGYNKGMADAALWALAERNDELSSDCIGNLIYQWNDHARTAISILAKRGDARSIKVIAHIGRDIDQATPTALKALQKVEGDEITEYLYDIGQHALAETKVAVIEVLKTRKGDKPTQMIGKLGMKDEGAAEAALQALRHRNGYVPISWAKSIGERYGCVAALSLDCLKDLDAKKEDIAQVIGNKPLATQLSLLADFNHHSGAKLAESAVRRILEPETLMGLRGEEVAGLSSVLTRVSQSYPGAVPHKAGQLIDTAQKMRGVYDDIYGASLR